MEISASKDPLVVDSVQLQYLARNGDSILKIITDIVGLADRTWDAVKGPYLSLFIIRFILYNSKHCT